MHKYNEENSAQSERDAICAGAYNVYKVVRDQAQAFDGIFDTAWEERAMIRIIALAEYNRICRCAWKEWERKA